MNKNILFQIQKNFECHINKSIYLYLSLLMKYIFLGEDNFQNKKEKEYLVKKLKEFTDKINGNIIKEEKNFIKIGSKSEMYSMKNFLNIINFVKKQNLMYAGNILEGILIIIFSYSIEVPRADEFGKLMFGNIARLRDISNEFIPNWYKKAGQIFQHEELKDIKTLLSKDYYIKDKFIDNLEKPVLLKLLLEITKIKLNFIDSCMTYNKSTKYVNNEKLDLFKVELRLMKYIPFSLDNNLGIENDFIINSIATLYRFINQKKLSPMKTIRSFLISVYVYYQNMHSQYIDFSETSKEKLNNQKSSENTDESDLVNVPFTYELKGANVEGRFANVIISPTSIEPRISNIDLSQNNIREPGCYELGKILSFNKNIKSLYLKKTLINGNYLNYFNMGFGIYDNFSLEYLNISFCFLNENIEISLPKLIKHLKGLKTLCISGNNIKGGAKTLFIILKKLYKKEETKLINLFMNNCFLDYSSLYELGELLQTPYCGLKSLGMGFNSKSYIINFLKKVKINRSLEELYIFKCKLDNNDIEDICRIVSNTNIKYLNLFKNDFNNFGKCLRILFRSKIIKEKEQNNDDINIVLSSTLTNLDLSNNVFSLISDKHILLINNLFKEKKNSTLSCFDCSHVLYGLFPDKKRKPSSIYKKNMDSLIDTLKNNKEFYFDLLEKRRTNEMKIQKYEKKDEKKKLRYISSEFIDYIKDDILKNNLAIFPTYLREKCIDFIKENIGKDKEKYKELIEEENIQNVGNISFKSEENDAFIQKMIDYILYEKARLENIEINNKLESKNLILI